MSTRSRIGLLRPDGTIASIYCHFDGYLEGVGKTLRENYASTEKVEQLIALGDLSVLDATPETSHAYMRDRGETGCEARISADEEEFLTIDSGQDYQYLWTGDEWFVWPMYGRLKNIRRARLTAALVAEALGG